MVKKKKKSFYFYKVTSKREHRMKDNKGLDTTSSTSQGECLDYIWVRTDIPSLGRQILVISYSNFNTGPG